ncbi:hypothetical protein RhiirA1_454334 [Rhizophagus irregularis]|uniref:Uncharacterized protein n=1 Tax=Rhizophagus irregularis TaxID=588596 RepID=A0A2N0S5C2_9GLOM|nr:hypothetical protein RhiirA1_454334 [Rhizophagus irregularis]
MKRPLMFSLFSFFLYDRVHQLPRRPVFESLGCGFWLGSKRQLSQFLGGEISVFDAWSLDALGFSGWSEHVKLAFLFFGNWFFSLKVVSTSNL